MVGDGQMMKATMDEDGDSNDVSRGPLNDKLTIVF